MSDCGYVPQLCRFCYVCPAPDRIPGPGSGYVAGENSWRHTPCSSRCVSPVHHTEEAPPSKYDLNDGPPERPFVPTPGGILHYRDEGQRVHVIVAYGVSLPSKYTEAKYDLVLETVAQAMAIHVAARASYDLILEPSHPTSLLLSCPISLPLSRPTSPPLSRPISLPLGRPTSLPLSRPSLSNLPR